MDKVSIVVPVYNMEKHVGKCIESIIRQDYENIELVLVNDGSKDKSLRILNKYKEKYPEKIVVVDQPNGGVDWARRTGLDHISGEYVMFVDSDDMLAPHAISIAYRTLKDQDVDVVSFEFHRFGSVLNREYKISHYVLPYYDRKLQHEELMKDLYVSFFGINLLPVSLCAKLYKASLFENWQPSGLKFGEDLTASMRIFPGIQSMYLIKDRLYNYRVGGTTGHYMPFFLGHCKALYKIKKEELIRTEYQKGYRPIIIELKNEVKTYIEQQLFYRKKKMPNG